MLKILSVIYVEFEYNWVSWILSGNPRFVPGGCKRARGE